MCKFRMPRPPNLVGRQTQCQAIRQHPLLAEAFPHHKNPRQMFSNSSITKAGISKANNKYMDMTVSTTYLDWPKWSPSTSANDAPVCPHKVANTFWKFVQREPKIGAWERDKSTRKQGLHLLHYLRIAPDQGWRTLGKVDTHARGLPKELKQP